MPSVVLAASCALLLAAPSHGRLPEGEGRELVETLCQSCHSTALLERSLGYDQAGWAYLIRTMVRPGPAQVDRISRYLAEHFPPNDRRAPVPVAGPLELDFETWVAPTPGQRARDPVEAPDGSIWWAGQWGDNVGRLDPVTGEMREYALPAGAKPHSVTPDAQGAIWYLGNGNGTVGRLDPETGAIDVFPMPDPEAKDPHTGVFADDGRFYFTLQRSNRVGRLDPESGQVDLIELDRPRSRPYGIKIDAQGTVWVACNGGPCLYRIDPDTLAQTRIRLPNAESHVRRLDIAPDGTVWYVNSGAGRLGHYDPATGELTEWPSPSGRASHPYALAWADGAVWYNESGRRPDMLVRFDPATETFQSWPIPSGPIHAGILRHMRVSRSGDLLLHQSATSHLLRVKLPAGGPGD
jgi:virginiamycin B lyase